MVGGPGSIDFRILGPFRVELDGTPVPVGTPKLRILLADLLLRAGHQVPVEELMQTIWDDEQQPILPRRTLQLHVTRLRAALGDAGALIITGYNGYRIDISSDQLDLGRFRDLMHVADHAAAAHEVQQEGAALERALSQWQGAPLVDVPSVALQSQAVPALIEEQLQAIERYADWRLRHRADEALSRELSELTAQHPTRERFWEQLIRAHQMAGRRSEALQAFHTVRHLLADKLGIDPSERLRQLHAEILNAGAKTSDHDGFGMWPIARQLPVSIPGFVGRHEELSRLDDLLHRAQQLGRAATALIAGPAGVGKTTLAAYWARQVADRFPDGQLWVDLRGYDPGQAIEPKRALTRMLRSLGVAPTQIPLALEDQVSLFRSLQTTRRVLTVLDNASDIGQIIPLLAISPGCATLITSRWLSMQGAIQVDDAMTLERFDADEARRFLAHRLGVARLQSGDDATGELVRISAGLPLALALISARAATEPQLALSDIAGELRNIGDDPHRLSDPWVSDEMRKAFSWSYRALTPAAARLFRLLARHPGSEVTVAAAASLAAITPEVAAASLSEHSRAGLVVQKEGAHYSQHDLLRSYANHLAESEETTEALRAATIRVLDHYLHTARAANLTLDPGRPRQALDAAARGVRPERFVGPDVAREWYSAEQSTLVGVVRLAEHHSLDRHVVQITGEIWEPLGQQAHIHEQLWVEHTALQAATRLDDVSAQLEINQSLAEIYTRLGQPDKSTAHLSQASKLVVRLDTPAEAAALLLTFAKAAGRRERREEALSYARQALRRFEEADDTDGQARALNAIGWHELHLGKYTDAVAHCRRALDLFGPLKNASAEAATLDSLGLAYLRSGDSVAATECLARAESLYRGIGDLPNLAEVLTHTAEVNAATGNPVGAEAARKEAEEIRLSMGLIQAA